MGGGGGIKKSEERRVCFLVGECEQGPFGWEMGEGAATLLF